METWQVIIVVGLVIAAGLIVMPMLGDDDNKDQDNNIPTPTPSNKLENRAHTWYSKCTAAEFDVRTYNDLSHIWSKYVCIGFKMEWDRIEYQAVNSTTIDRVLLYSITSWELIDYEDITMLRLGVGTSRIEIPCVIFKQDPNGDWAQYPKSGLFYTEEKSGPMYLTTLTEGYNCATAWNIEGNPEYATQKDGYYEWEAPENGIYKLPRTVTKNETT